MNHENLPNKKNLKMSNQESKNFTRNCIKTALLHLLKDNTFEKITITSIIERSGVSRAGFYRNYSSKEEVLEDVSMQIFQSISNYYANEKYADNPYQRYLDLFIQMKNHSDMLNLFFHAKISRDKIFNFNEYLVQFFAHQSPEEHYRTIAIWYSLKEIIIDWMQNGMKESPEEMAEILVEIFHM